MIALHSTIHFLIVAFGILAVLVTLGLLLITLLIALDLF
jgi:hypothetical protein